MSGRIQADTTWRENRQGRWYHDIGYQLQVVLQRHRYQYANKGAKPDDPGWHACTCGGWEGYWSSFEPHVADHLRAVVKCPQCLAVRVGSAKVCVAHNPKGSPDA